MPPGRTAVKQIGSAVTMELQTLHKDGSRFPVHVGISPIRLGEGQFSMLSLVDISSGKAIESALRDSEDRFHEIIEALPQLVWTCTPDGKCEFLSARWAAYTGSSEGAGLGLNFMEFIHPADQETLREAWAAGIESGLEFRTEHRIRRADGLYRWFEALAVPLHNSANEVVKWFGCTTDVHEARETRCELEREQKRLANLISLSPAVFCSFSISPDGETHIPCMTTDFTSLLGVAMEDLDGDVFRLTSHFNPEDLAEVRASIRSSAESMLPFQSSFRIQHPQKGERWIEAHFAPTVDLDDSVVWHGFLTDISDRKRVEKDQQFLLQLGTEVQAASSAKEIGTVSLRMLAEHLDVSRASLSLVDMPRAEIAMLHEHVRFGNPALPGVHPLNRWFTSPLIDTLATGTAVAIDNTALHPFTAANYASGFQQRGVNAAIAIPLRRNGQWISVLTMFSVTPRAWRQSEVDLAGAAAERIWPSFEAARALAAERDMHISLAASEERLRLALDAAAIGIWENNAVTGERHWDPRCKAMFGFSPDKIIDSKLVLDCILPEDRVLVEQQISEYFDPSGSGHVKAAYRIINANDGTLRHIYGQGQMFFGGEGDERHAMRSIGTMQDVTALKRGEEALRRANGDLEQFAYAAAHDLQEPLRNVGLATQLLASRYQGRLDAEADQLLKICLEGPRRMEAMVKDLLAYSRALTSDEDTVVSADANAVLAIALSNLQVAINEAEAQITFDALPSVRMTEVHLLQILQNLISNSLKYAGKKGSQIHVAAARRDHQQFLFVQDDGLGIPPEFHERAFGVFKRLHSREIPGTGIGLALCKRVVEHYGEKIWIESELGRGTKVLFTVKTT